MEAPDDPQVQEFRAQITAADDDILAALNRRIELVAALHALKRERGYPMRDAAREDSMLDELRAGNSGPLSDEGIRQLLAHPARPDSHRGRPDNGRLTTCWPSEDGDRGNMRPGDGREDLLGVITATDLTRRYGEGDAASTPCGA